MSLEALGGENTAMAQRRHCFGHIDPGLLAPLEALSPAARAAVLADQAASEAAA